MTVTGNTVSGATVGVHLKASATIAPTIHSNIITGNTTGLINLSTNLVDATNNYWGDPTGPYNNPYNTCGLGNTVSSLVTFMPWWTTSTGIDGSGTLAVHNITKVPSTYYCKIQDAINDAGTGGETILVGNGTFYEHIVINTANLILKNSSSPVIDGAVQETWSPSPPIM